VISRFPFFVFMFIKSKKTMKNKRLHILTMKEKMTIQLWLGVFLAVMGCILLWVGLFLPPMGVIHASVLTAMGEVFTFSGALIGIDYSYKYKSIKYIAEMDKEEKKEEIEENDEE